jgi:hypothetical protein
LLLVDVENDVVVEAKPVNGRPPPPPDDDDDDAANENDDDGMGAVATADGSRDEDGNDDKNEPNIMVS